MKDFHRTLKIVKKIKDLIQITKPGTFPMTKFPLAKLKNIQEGKIFFFFISWFSSLKRFSQSFHVYNISGLMGRSNDRRGDRYNRGGGGGGGQSYRDRSPGRNDRYRERERSSRYDDRRDRDRGRDRDRDRDKKYSRHGRDRDSR